MVRRLLIIVTLLLSSTIPVLLGKDDPVIIVVQDLGTTKSNTHRVPALIPFECRYDSMLCGIVVTFMNPIGEIFVEVENRTTGEYVDVLIPSNVGTQLIPCPGSEGYCTITLTLSNGRRYCGFFIV